MPITRLAVLLLLLASPVAAHMGSTSYLHVESTETGASVTADVDLIDVAYELSLPAERAAVMARSAEIVAWLTRGITVSAGDLRCSVAASEPQVVKRDRKTYVSVPLRYACPSGGERILRDDTVFDDDPQHEALVRLARGDEVTAGVLRSEERTISLGAARSSTLALVSRFLYQGVLHLWLGFDHVLFLVSLILVAGEVAAREGFARAVRHVAIIVTGFTAGHSLTLVAAALDWVRLDTRWVESAIALSIVVVALWNMLWPQMRKGLPWLAAAFGLVHGFGFSNVLRELVMPGRGRVVALLSFNVGIEIAQLAIVAALIGPLAWLAKTTPTGYRRYVVIAGSAGIAGIASYWFVERAFLA